MLDIIAMILGIIGTLLLASKKEYDKRKIFGIYLISNILFLIYGIVINSIGIIGLNAVYLILSIKGVFGK